MSYARTRTQNALGSENGGGGGGGGGKKKKQARDSHTQSSGGACCVVSTAKRQLAVMQGFPWCTWWSPPQSRTQLWVPGWFCVMQPHCVATHPASVTHAMHQDASAHRSEPRRSSTYGNQLISEDFLAFLNLFGLNGLLGCSGSSGRATILPIRYPVLPIHRWQESQCCSKISVKFRKKKPPPPPPPTKNTTPKKPPIHPQCAAGAAFKKTP